MLMNFSEFWEFVLSWKLYLKMLLYLVNPSKS